MQGTCRAEHISIGDRTNMIRVDLQSNAMFFGSVDDAAQVWLNGQHAGTFDVGGGGWLLRFSLDVTDKLQPGKNQITVRVLDRWGAGGIWRPVKLFVRN